MKKYKSLQDIYLEKAAGKSVAPIPGASVSFIKDNATILIQRDPPNGEVEQYDVSDEKLTKLKDVIDRTEIKDKTLPEQIVKISNLPAQAVSEIIAHLEGYPEEQVNKITEYIRNRSINLKDLDNKNVFDVFKRVGIPENFSKYLYGYQLKQTGPSVGKGEAFFSLMLRGARKAMGGKKADAETGDVRIGGEEVEIKGQDARLKGQKGFGSPESVAKFWSESLKKASANIPDINKRIPSPTSYDWNFKEGGYALDKFGQELIRTSPDNFNLNDLKTLWKGGLSLLYPVASEDKFSFIDEAYKSGAFDKEVFVKELIKFVSNLYFDIQNLNFIVLSKFDLRPKEFRKDGQASPTAAARYGLLKIITREDINSGAIFSKASFKLPQIGGAPGPWGSGLGINVM
jgi:hypothetical protein